METLTYVRILGIVLIIWALILIYNEVKCPYRLCDEGFRIGIQNGSITYFCGDKTISHYRNKTGSYCDFDEELNLDLSWIN